MNQSQPEKAERGIEERVKTGYIPVTLDYAPTENGEEFDDWCEKYGFTPLGSGRRAWCGNISTYFRDALGVARNPSGDIFLFDKSDLEPFHQELQKARESERERINHILYSHIEMARDSLKNAVADQVAPYKHQLGRLLQAKSEILNILSDNLN